MIDGTQYLAAIAGSGAEYDSPGKLMVFKLGGAQTLPQPPLRSTEIPEPPTLTASAETVDRGNALYHQICANCHRGLGVPMVIAAAAPDLKMMTLDTHKKFSEIVHDGTKQELGMPGFGDSLDEESLSAIRAFIISRAIEEREARLLRQSSDP